MASTDGPAPSSAEAETKIPQTAATLSKDAPVEKEQEAELPKLSAADFRAYNRLADMMNAYVSLIQPQDAHLACSRPQWRFRTASSMKPILTYD
jgi:hypothetical protein